MARTTFPLYLSVDFGRFTHHLFRGTTEDGLFKLIDAQFSVDFITIQTCTPRSILRAERVCETTENVNTMYEWHSAERNVNLGANYWGVQVLFYTSDRRVVGVQYKPFSEEDDIMMDVSANNAYVRFHLLVDRPRQVVLVVSSAELAVLK